MLSLWTMEVGKEKRVANKASKSMNWFIFLSLTLWRMKKNNCTFLWVMPLPTNIIGRFMNSSIQAQSILWFFSVFSLHLTCFLDTLTYVCMNNRSTDKKIWANKRNALHLRFLQFPRSLFHWYCLWLLWKCYERNIYHILFQI